MRAEGRVAHTEYTEHQNDLTAQISALLVLMAFLFETDNRALQTLESIDSQTSLRILKKRWCSLNKHERMVVDSVIRLTFSSHWYGDFRCCARALMRCATGNVFPYAHAERTSNGECHSVRTLLLAYVFGGVYLSLLGTDNGLCPVASGLPLIGLVF